MVNRGAIKYSDKYPFVKWIKESDPVKDSSEVSLASASKERSFHHISSANNTVYVMTYNELISSNDRGKTWQSSQKGLPRELYTFNVIEYAHTHFAGQWDGVYSKTNSDLDWKFSRKGLPPKFAATNLTAYNGVLVFTTSERKLRSGLTTER